MKDDIDNNSQIIRIQKESKRIEEDCTYSGKSHLNSADKWNKIHYWLGIPATISAALAAADIFSGTVISGVLAALAAALIAASTFVNPSKRASEHEIAGNQYLALFKRTRRFREIDLFHLENEDARARVEEISNKRDDLNESTPNPLQSAVEKTRSGIEKGETEYVADKGKDIS